LKRKVIEAEGVPPAKGPYSHGVMFGNFVFTCGQIGRNSKTGKIPDGVEEQTKNALDNMKAILKAAGTSMENVVKVNVYLHSMADFANMNKVYAEYFPVNPPARTTLEVPFPRPYLKLEIEAIACVPNKR